MSQLSEQRALLERFISGRLSEADSAALLERLVEDEEALAVVDQIWAEQEISRDALRVPDLPPEQARRIEQRLFNSLRRGDLGGAAVRAGTEGFVNVLLALLRPLFNPSGPPGDKAQGDSQ